MILTINKKSSTCLISKSFIQTHTVKHQTELIHKLKQIELILIYDFPISTTANFASTSELTVPKIARKCTHTQLLHYLLSTYQLFAILNSIYNNHLLRAPFPNISFSHSPRRTAY